jgi:signal transduction histidine kinase
MFWLSLIACFASLALTLAFLLAGARGRLGTRIALAAVSMFAWNFSSLAHGLSRTHAWVVLDLAASPITVALGLDLALTFVGRVRQYRVTLTAAYLWLGAISLSSALTYFVPGLRWWSNSVGMNLLFLLGLSGAFGLAIVLLAGHARRHDGLERRRTLVLMGGMVLGGIAGSSVLLNGFGYYFPASAAPGALVGTIALALGLAHEDLVGVRIGALSWLGGGVLSAVACGALLLVFLTTDPSSSAQLFGALTVVLTVGVLARELAAQRWRVRKYQTEAMVRGRLSDQFVHDLRNPLAALQGAAQFLEAEREQLSSDQARMIDLVLRELERIARLVDEHHRMARAEPHRVPTNVRDLLERLGSHASTAAPSHPVVVAVEPAAERADLDADLVTLALENLIRNAREALPDGGEIRIVGRAESSAVVLEVTDAGTGLDPRASERAFDELFTTKPKGKGLGLAFVRRVARAHGGDATLTSAAGRGTTATMRLRVGAR